MQPRHDEHVTCIASNLCLSAQLDGILDFPSRWRLHHFVLLKQSHAIVSTLACIAKSINHSRDGSCDCLLTLGSSAENPRGHCAGDSGLAVMVAGGGMTVIDMSLVSALGIFAT